MGRNSVQEIPKARLLITRPAAAAARFHRQIEEAMGGTVDPIISPLLRIETLQPEIDRDGLRGLVLTSAQAIPAAVGLHLGEGFPAYCVGEQTAALARAAGFGAQSANGDADDLVALILSRDDHGPLLHLRGAHMRGNVAGRLQEAGIICREAVVYDQRVTPLTDQAVAALSGIAPLIVPLFSPRTAEIFAATVPITAPLHLVALSAAVAEPLQSLPFRQLITVRQPQADYMIREVIKMLTHGDKS